MNFKLKYAFTLLITLLINNINCNQDFKRLENELERQIQAQIQLLNSSSLIEEDKSAGSNKNKFKLKIDLEFNLNKEDDDKCAPKFDKLVYNFDVVENIVQLIEPIYVEDCDEGPNGYIYLSSSNKDFVFKLDKVYKQSTVGLQMMKSYDYDELKSSDDNFIEFEIYARGSNQSSNKYETKAKVRVNIESKNEYMPEFVLPEPIYVLKDGMPTQERQKIYSYKVPENKDFEFDVKAVDQDKGVDGRLVYSIKYLDKEDTFWVLTELNNKNETYHITVPGRFLDSTSLHPIIFAVHVEDYGSPKLSNEIVIYLRPQSATLTPIYFEFEKYEFRLLENAGYLEQPPFRLRLINDNLKKSTIMLQELHDPLNLITCEVDDESDVKFTASNHEIAKYMHLGDRGENDELELDNEMNILLYPTDYKRDLDKVYIDNGYKSVYSYKLRAYMHENPNMYTDIVVSFKLVDANDNKPKFVITREEDFKLDALPYVNASLHENFGPNTLINLNDTFLVVKLNDEDFSDEFGVRSLNFNVNDTRFYVDNEFVMSELDRHANKSVVSNGVSLLVRVVFGHDFFARNEEVIWLNVTCEDNYFNRRFLKTNYWSKSIIIRLQILKDEHHSSSPSSLTSSASSFSLSKPLFDHDTFFFKVDENWTGFVGRVRAKLNKRSVEEELIVYSLEPNSIDQKQTLSEHFELRNSNEIYLKKELDFEKSERVFNFSLVAYNHKHDENELGNEFTLDSNFFNAFYAKAQIVIVVNDLNDETPVFEPMNKFEFNLYKKKLDPGHHLGYVYALDLDNADLNSLKFELASHLEKFELIKTDTKGDLLQSAILVNKVELESHSTSEDKADFELDISVRDQARHESKGKVSVYLRGKHETPELKWFDGSSTESAKNNSFSVQVDENTPENTKLLSLKAKSNDEHNHKDLDKSIKYKLIGENPYFKVDENTGDLLTTQTKLDREQQNPSEQLKQSKVFVQAYYPIDDGNKKIFYWSPIGVVNVDLKDLNDKVPKFISPFDNHTTIELNLRMNGLANQTTGLINLYKVSAIDSDLDDSIEYKIAEQKIFTDILDSGEDSSTHSQETHTIKPDLSLNLPFDLNKETGELKFDSTKLEKQDYLRLFHEQFAIGNLNEVDHSDLIRIRLKINATDKARHVSSVYLNVETHLKHLVDQYRLNLLAKQDEFNELTYDFEINQDNWMKLNKSSVDEFKKKTLRFSSFNFSLNESAQPNTILAKLVTYLNKEKTKNLLENFQLVPMNDTNRQEIDNPELYFRFDSSNGGLKLIRKLNYETVKEIKFSLIDYIGTLINRQIDIRISVQDDNDSPPTIVFNEQEKLNGENLILVSIGDLSGSLLEKFSAFVSSTPPPRKEPRPAIPEMNVPSIIVEPPRSEALYKELEDNKQKLNEFNKLNTIRVYEISDPDSNNVFSVRFVKESTSKFVIDKFSVSTNGTHVIFKKKADQGLDDEIKRDDKSKKTDTGVSYHFLVELNDGKHATRLNGELFDIDPRQLQHMLLFNPINGRFHASVFRTSDKNIKLAMRPNLQIRNPFPFDIYLELTGSNSKFFKLNQKLLKPVGLINFIPVEIGIYLPEPLSSFEETNFMTVIPLGLSLKSNNSYLNSLLETMGNLKILIEILDENRYEPRIISIEPSDKVIHLDEGAYVNKEIASIRAIDRDMGDSGRLEYYLLGSYILYINRANGKVYLNGTLDAESEQVIKFYCYSRDMAPKPFGMNSELIEFKIIINDVNEFKPVMQPSLNNLNIKENDESIVYPSGHVNEFRFDCYDKDANSNLEITLNSIRYVNKHDSFNYMDDMEPPEHSFRHVIKDLFRLVYESQPKNFTDLFNQSLSIFDTTSSKYARLALTRSIDYERLFKPNETLIRVDVICSDGRYESLSKILIDVKDLNDNAPIFIPNNNQNMLDTDLNSSHNITIRRNESNLLETLVQVKAIDFDLSTQYGNQSLIYTINYCIPNIYNIYIDKRTGHISSKLVIDLDTDEIIAKRKEIFNKLAPKMSSDEQIDDSMELDARQLSELNAFINNYNRITCSISVNDSFGIAQSLSLNNNSTSLSDTMNLTILIDNVNDNAPEIDLENDFTIEVKEGENTRGLELLSIRVFDRDDATGLKCLFPNGFTFLDHNEPFEFKTGQDKNDPHTAWCILKVRDDSFIEYDIAKKSNYLLELIVWDRAQPPVYPNKGSTNVQIRVKVTPVNKKPPTFINGNEETFYVLDSIQPNTLIGTIAATDLENPNPDRIIYRIENRIKESFEKFYLAKNKNSTTSYWGSIGLFTRSKLQVNESPYILSVIAYDGPIDLKETLSSRKIFKIYVLNKGSSSVWSNTTNGLPVDFYTVRLDEEVPSNTTLIKVKVNIPDEHIYQTSSANKSLKYSIEMREEEGGKNPFYVIDSITGLIQTSGVRIDYEEKDAVRIQLMRNIRVKAASTDGFFTYFTHVSVSINDINDNKPIFDEYTLLNTADHKLCVLENRTSQHGQIYVGKINAFDSDSGSNGMINYKLDEHSQNFAQVDELFHLDKIEGRIWIKEGMGRKIDRELNDTIRINIVAYDLGTPLSLNSSIEISLCVLDINDNWPQFNNLNETDHQVFSIEENSVGFEHVFSAFDLDYGLNSSLFYYITRDGDKTDDIIKKFRVDPLSGRLSLNTPLDYESQKVYEFELTCSDSGEPFKLTTSIKILVNVLDLNDNAPIFNKKSDRVSYTESRFRKGIELYKFMAFDSDPSEAYRQTSYHIKSIYRASNSTREYIKDDSLMNSFSLDAKSGQLAYDSNLKLNSLITNEYIIQVEAVDDNKPVELRDQFNLTLIVLPSNDKLPVFERNYRSSDQSEHLNEENSKRSDDSLLEGQQKRLVLHRRSLAESTSNDYVIDIIKAHDPNQHGINYYLDSVEHIFYNSSNADKSIKLSNTGRSLNKIVDINGGDLFKLGKEDGVLKAIQVRSAYMADAYKLNVRAVSTLNESLSAQTNIYVSVNTEQDSLFEAHFFNVTVNENSPSNVVVFNLRQRLKAANYDRKLEYKLNDKYSTPEQFYSKWFKLDELSGQIQTNSGPEANIDYEKYKQVLLSIDVYDFNFVKSQLDFIESVIIKININDLNDNAPQFDLGYVYEPSINEDDSSTIGTERLITSFKAFDLDASVPNSLIEFAIESVELPLAQYGSKDTISKASFKLVKSNDDIVGLYKISGANLDRDSKYIGDKINIIIKAEDKALVPHDRLSTKKKFVVTLIDLNDNPPQILNDQISSVEMREDQMVVKPFFRIEAIDLDEGVNAELMYEVLEERAWVSSRPSQKLSSKHVSIDKDGNLILINPIDYELTQFIEFTIKIYDKSTRPMSISKSFRVNVINVNDNYPQFKNLPTSGPGSKCQMNVYEGELTDLNRNIYKFIAIDADNVEGDFDFSILDLSTSDPKTGQLMSVKEEVFKIDKKTGVLSLSFPLDRETTDNYKLSLSLKDQEVFGIQLETKVECYISVLDINDNYPKFDESLKNFTEFSIFPLINQVTFISWFRVSDPDLGLNGTVVYKLEEVDNDDEKMFYIDSNGYLTMKLVNYNKKNNNLHDSYTLKLTASDLGTRVRLETVLNVVIRIDSNYFKFNQQSNNRLNLEVIDVVYLEENSAQGKFIARVNATNSFNAVVKQTNKPGSSLSTRKRNIELKFKLLTCNDTFRIDEQSGEISVLDSMGLDYEKVKEFRLTIEAYETKISSSGSGTSEIRYGMTNMIVKLKNLNDNPAEFNEAMYTTSIQENTVKLPFELSLSSLIKINDQDLLNDQMNEPIPDQLSPIDVRLVGADSASFRLVKLLGSSIYTIEAIEKFDYETKSNYNFEILAWDGMFRSKSNISISIIDLNDNNPEFERKTYEFSLNENSARHTWIGKVNAKDLDGTQENNRVIYKIISVHALPGSQSQRGKELYNLDEAVFGINDQKGEMNVLNSDFLDRERIEMFNFSIMAFNIEPSSLIGGSVKSSERMAFDLCHVIIRLNDINDNAPKFDKQVYTINLREKSYVSRLLANLNAIDPDLAENGTVRYLIDSVNGRKWRTQNDMLSFRDVNRKSSFLNENKTEFYIDPVHGDLVLNSYFDMELPQTPKSFEIYVIAYDLGSMNMNEEKCLIIINLIDINDHRPHLTHPLDSFISDVNEKVFEFEENNQNLNEPLFVVEAFDPDYSRNPVKYYLDNDLNNDWSSFTIDEHTGKVFTKIRFDYEEKNEYVLRVLSVDSGNMIDLDPTHDNSNDSFMLNDLFNSYTHKQTTTLIVKIKVIDLDDNEPKFSSIYENGSPFISNVSHTLEVGSTVCVLPLAVDRDTLEQNNRIKYFIIDGNQDGMFELNETSNEIKLLKELERKLIDKYTLTIRATSKNDRVKKRSLNTTWIDYSDSSVLKVVINVVQDKLVVEFDDQNYYASLQLNTNSENKERDTSLSSNIRRLYKLESDTNGFTESNAGIEFEDAYMKHLQQSASLFYARAHLKQRRLKRQVKFSIDMIQYIRLNEQSAVKLSPGLCKSIEQQYQPNDASNSAYLFLIDSSTGKIYVNRNTLTKSSYKIGDRFILTVSAQTQTDLEINVDDENTLTHLTIRLTDKDYSFLLPINNNFKIDHIIFNYLNPLRSNYIPRVLEADGVKLTIQDLSPSRIVNTNIDMSYSGGFNILFQVETRNDHKQVNLDLFVNMWKNYSASNIFLKELNNFIDRQPTQNARKVDILDGVDSRPFYLNWLFWLLLIIGILLIIILVFFVFCIKLTRKQHKHGQSGIIIEYPPGINPVFKDGVLNLNSKSKIKSNKKSLSKTRVVPVEDDPRIMKEYEDQELELVMEDDLSDTEQNNPVNA